MTKTDFVRSETWQLFARSLAESKSNILEQLSENSNLTMEEFRYLQGFVQAINGFLTLPDKLLTDGDKINFEPQTSDILDLSNKPHQSPRI